MGGLRTVFMGTPAFALASLDALIDAGHDVARVYTGPPRPAGRGYRRLPSPVHARAEARGIEVRHPRGLRGPDAAASFAEAGADIAVVAAFGSILPAPVLAAPRLGCLNVHASLLPRWRGAAPIQRAILAGDRKTGVTIMKMDEGLDTGPILARSEIAIAARTDAGELHDRLAELGARLLVETLPDYAAGGLAPAAQPGEGVTRAAKIDRAETRIDWRRPAARVDRQIRAFAPRPGAWFETAGQRVRVLAAHVVDAAGGRPGVVIDDQATIACAAGALRLDRLQRQGRAPMDAASFLRGFALGPGTCLCEAP